MNTIYCGECAQVMRDHIDDNSIDLTVTSPPYDNLRKYNGFVFPFEEIAKELYRVTKVGGVVVWIVADATIKGSETGTSFRQALYFKDIGFNLHDTMIYSAYGTGAKGSNLAYWQAFEYMFVFTKGKIKTVNRLCDKPNVTAGSVTWSGDKTNNIVKTRTSRGKRVVADFGIRENVWKYPSNSGDKTIHSAPFPEKLAEDHILSWSNESDIVFDPMCGSGTTLKMAKKNNRQFIGIDISQEYVDLSWKRVNGKTK